MRTMKRFTRSPRRTTRREALPPLPVANANDAKYFAKSDAALSVSDPLTRRAVTLDYAEQSTLYRALATAADHGHGDAASLAAKLGCF